MQTEDLLDACLVAQARGQAPLEILAHRATSDQRVEVESLLDLAGRLRSQAAPPLRPDVRDAMAARLAVAMRADVAAGAWIN